MNRLQRLSLFILGTAIAFLVFISSLTSSFEIIEPLEIHCVESSLSYRLSHKPPPTLSRTSWQLYTWDLTNSKPQDTQMILSYLDSVSEQSSQAIIFNLQGVRPIQLKMLKSLLAKEGGCWAYAPLWRRPTWLSWLDGFDFNIYSLFWDKDSINESYEHGIWTGIIGDCRQLKLRAERWALPARPGRWPKRILHRQPAILAMTIDSLNTSHQTQTAQQQAIQVLNIKLTDTQHKHQAGARALQSLEQTPLAKRFKTPWIILGDWRVNPPKSPPHKLVQYRFQRFSLSELSKSYIQLFSEQNDPQIWGRWRLGHDRFDEPSVIDLAYASEGSLSSPKLDLDSLPWIGYAHQETQQRVASTVPVMNGEQRAPLQVKWNLKLD